MPHRPNLREFNRVSLLITEIDELTVVFTELLHNVNSGKTTLNDNLENYLKIALKKIVEMSSNTQEILELPVCQQDEHLQTHCQELVNKIRGLGEILVAMSRVLMRNKLEQNLAKTESLENIFDKTLALKNTSKIFKKMPRITIPQADGLSFFSSSELNSEEDASAYTSSPTSSVSKKLYRS